MCTNGVLYRYGAQDSDGNWNGMIGELIRGVSYFLSFFLKFLADTCLFGGHWYPCFGFLGASPTGFKAITSFLHR